MKKGPPPVTITLAHFRFHGPPLPRDYTKPSYLLKLQRRLEVGIIPCLCQAEVLVGLGLVSHFLILDPTPAFVSTAVAASPLKREKIPLAPACNWEVHVSLKSQFPLAHFPPRLRPTRGRTANLYTWLAVVAPCE